MKTGRQTMLTTNSFPRLSKVFKYKFRNILLSGMCVIAIACILIYTKSSYALVTNYSFAASSGTFTPLSGATTAPLSGGTLDEGVYNSLPIGFTFYFDGRPYTTVSASTNGWMTFDQVLTFANSGNSLATSTTRPIIAPLWDDLEMDASGSFSYLTEGAAGNRIFTAQWINVQWSWFISSPSISFQVKLYEATGQVQFIYRQEPTLPTGQNASIGIAANGTGSGNFLSLNDTSASPAVSSTVEQTNLTTKPATGQIYMFTPPAATPAAPTGLSFNGIALTSINVNWVDNSTTESMFVVYQSTDGTNFTEAGSVNSSSVATTGTPYSLNVPGLSSTTNYTFRVEAATEGLPHSAPLEGTQATATGTISGTKVVGNAPSDYLTLNAAFTAIQTNGVGGPIVLELKSAYSGTSPLTIGFLGTSPTNTVTVRPAAGATGCVQASFGTGPAIDFNGARYVIFDGRPGGVGTIKQLTIESNNTSGIAIRFINEGSNNSVIYSTVRGASTSTTGGVVLFSTTTGPQGNDNNTVSNCDLRDGSSTPVNIIYSAGTFTTASQYNSGNIISNNSIFNFFSVISAFHGVRLTNGNTDWIISGNSIYQTATRTPTTGNPHAAIRISGGGNFSITQNYIGGSAPNATGGPWTMNGTASTRLIGIDLGVGSVGTTSVQGNIITNFNLTSPSDPLTGINITDGNVDVGTVTGNVIGGTTGTGSIVATSSSSSTVVGIVSSNSTGIVNVYNNTIGSITTNGSVASAGVSITGISVGGGMLATVANNMVGNATTPNSLNANSASTGGQNFTGIGGSPAFGGRLFITNNTIANVNNNTISTFGGQTIGINGGSGMITITGNTVRNLSTDTRLTQTQSSAGLIGIAQQNSSLPGQTISQNNVHSLNSRATSVAVTVYGIYISGSTSGANMFDRNLIYDLTSASTAAAVINGMYCGGFGTYQNNMIRLGTEATAANLSIIGMVEMGSSGNNYYHNSIYIGGTTTGAGSATTYAFQRATGVGFVNVLNNIFVNARTNGTGTGKHYNIHISTTSFLTLNYNVYFRTGASTPFGVVGFTDHANFAAWKTATSLDANSIFADPNFVDPIGTTPDLHVQNLTPIESAGTYLPAVNNDFDGETRLSLSPADIGADAGDFTVVSDVLPPIIIYSALGNTASVSDRNFDAVLIDGTGLANGALTPRVYYRERNCAGASAYVSTQGALISGTDRNGTWNFVLDYSLLPGGGSASGYVIDYFVAAQDTLGNLASNPAGALGTNVASLTTFPASPNSYQLTIDFNGSVGVGGAGNGYNSLTAAAPCGLFAALNAGTVSGNLTISITGNLTETGLVSLNQLTENPAGSNFTVQINGNGFTTSGNASTSLINLNGADRITFNGVNISNTNSSGATIRFVNDASNNVITNSIISGSVNSSSNGVISIGAGTTTGNDNNVIQLSTIRDSSSLPNTLIYQQGAVSVLNSGTQILNNQLFNFSAVGVMFDPTGNENTTITGNTFYESAPRFTNLVGISFASQGTNTISLNTIRDLDTSVSATGILLQDARSTTVSRNRIYGFSSSSGGSSTIMGINFSGLNSVPASVTLTNNMVTIIPDFTTNQQIFGIRESGFSGNTFNAYNNTVLIGGTSSGNQPSWGLMRSFSSQSTHTSRNNIVFNNRTGGTGNYFAGGDQSANSGTFTSSNNLFTGTGATAANFMDYGTSSFGTAVSWTTWKNGPPARDTNSTGSLASSVNVAELFINPVVGNLNIKSGASSSCDALGAAVALVDNKATPVAGLTTDFDGVDTRNASTPDIGADEFVVDRTCAGGASLSSGTFDNVIVGPGGATLNGNATIRGSLSLGDRIDTGANTLTISCAATINGASVSNYVIGNLKKDFCATQAFQYPVGTVDGSMPVDVTVTTLNVSPSSLTVRANDGVANATPPLNSSTTLQAFWTLTEGGDLTTNLTFNYLQSDVMGNETNYRLFRITGGVATNFPPPAAIVNASLNTATINGVTDFSDWTVGEPLAPTSISATISGQIQTNTGMPLSGVQVSLLDATTIETRTTVTDVQGHYQFESVMTGREIMITPTKQGYSFNPQNQVFSHIGVRTGVNFVATPDVPQTRNVICDFDGDGKTDLTVFRPSDATWYILQSSNGVMRSEQWGLGTDRLVPADYDGDGKTDVAVFRASNGTWYIRQSATSTLRSVQWGVSDDVTLPGDYDGDHLADLAVWRPSTGTWYIVQSSTGLNSTINWGTQGDKVVPADYDGDGRIDVAVWRPSTGTWYIINSRDDSQVIERWGLSMDTPVTGDYDADGKADLAVFRAETSTWYVKRSSDNTINATQHGTDSDLLTPGDYDGDGKTDRAVWRHVDGAWYILQSATTTPTTERWGMNGDVPAPSASVH